ncbi:MAG: proton-conducting transporter membrane subunit [Cyclobacteriaceae bacterium]
MLTIFFTASVLLAVLAYFIKKKIVSHWIVIIHSSLICVLTIHEFNYPGGVQLHFFEADHLSLIFLGLLGFISLMAALHYVGYARTGEVPVRNINIHNLGTILFTSAIVGVLMTNHFGMLWALIEATTLATALLIQHDRNEASMEATWKYLFVCSVAIAIAFAGVLFLGFATSEANVEGFSFEAIRNSAHLLDSNWTRACFLFIIVGFSVKMGLVPMFNVDIDAKDASPSPVGALLASVVLNAGFVSIFRFYEAFSGTEIYQWMNNVITITAILSLFFSAAYILKVRNLKRLMAYSSMEHAAVAMLAFASGGVGYFAAIFHLSLHALIKSTMFFQVGQLHNIFGSKLDFHISDYLKINPLGGLVLLACMLSIFALPPSGMFISELMMLEAIFIGQPWWLMIMAFLLILFIIYGMSKRILSVIYEESSTNGAQLQNIRRWESMVQIVVIITVFYIGFVKPHFIVSIIQSAIQSLP